MDKDLFVQSINSIKRQLEYDNKCAEAFKIILPQIHVIYESSSIAISQLIDVLKTETNDQTEHSWIDYWIWELNCGELYTEGCARYSDESPIDISTPEALYDFLTLPKL